MQTSSISPRRSRPSSTTTGSSAPMQSASVAPVKVASASPMRPDSAAPIPSEQPSVVAPEIAGDEIARRAFARWENSDRSHGRDQEHWFAAEEELRRGNASPNGPDGNKTASGL